MTSFSETLFRTKLKDLVPTEASIRQLSLWLIHHRRHSSVIVKTWFDEIKNASKVERKITLLYLVNDVVQNSKKKGPEFTKGFGGKILDAYKIVISHDKITEKNVGSLDRMANVWQQRHVFASDVTQQVKQCIGKAVLAAKGKAKKRSSSTKEESITEKKKKFEQELDDVVFELTGSPKESSPKDEAEVAASEGPKESPPDMSEVLELVKKLINSASGDEPVRKKIAELPTEVADPKSLEKVNSETAAAELYQNIENACILLADYNKRLECEMEDRRHLAKILPPFIQSMKDGLAKREQELQEMRAKLAKVSEVRTALHEHMSNLPDIEQKPANPLPAVVDLFS